MTCVKPSAWSAVVSFSSRPWFLQLATLALAIPCPRSFANGAATHLNRKFGHSRLFQTVSSFRFHDFDVESPSEGCPSPACKGFLRTWHPALTSAAIKWTLDGFDTVTSSVTGRLLAAKWRFCRPERGQGRPAGQGISTPSRRRSWRTRPGHRSTGCVASLQPDRGDDVIRRASGSRQPSCRSVRTRARTSTSVLRSTS